MLSRGMGWDSRQGKRDSMKDGNGKAERIISAKMDQHTCKRAAAMVGGKVEEWSDPSTPGLTIRIRKKEAAWTLKARLLGKFTTRSIGPVGLVTWTDAKERAQAAKDLMKRGIDPAPTLAEALLNGEIVRTGDIEKDGMTWVEGRDDFLEWAKNGGVAPRTYRDYRDTLIDVETKDFRVWESGKLCKHIKPNDVRGIMETIFKRSRSQSHHKLRVVKSCFSHLAGKSDSGIDVSPARDVAPIKISKQEKNAAGTKLGRLLSPEAIGKLIWQLADYDGTPSAKLAATLLVLTCQRIATVRVTRKSEFRREPDGTMVWAVDAEHTKGKRPHELPLSPLTWRVVQQAIALAPTSSPLVFPQIRERRSGSGKDREISYLAVRNALGDLALPHDPRRTLTSNRRNLGVAMTGIQMILHHREGRSSVADEFYDFQENAPEKKAVLDAWENYVLEQAAAQAPDGRGPIPEYLREAVLPDVRRPFAGFRARALDPEPEF
jgi:integrase